MLRSKFDKGNRSIYKGPFIVQYKINSSKLLLLPFFAPYFLKSIDTKCGLNVLNPIIFRNIEQLHLIIC